MMRWLGLVAVVVGVAAAVSVAAVGFGRDPSVVSSHVVSKPAPELAGPTLDRKRFDLAEQRGQVVLVNVWASWCGPCRTEYPVLVAAAEGLGPRGLVVVGINTQDSRDKAQAFLQELGGAAYPSVSDDDGTHAINWGTFGVPETFLVDRDGTVRTRLAGEVTAEWIDQNVVPLLDR